MFCLLSHLCLFLPYFSSFPLLLDFLKPESGPSNEVIGIYIYMYISPSLRDTHTHTHAHSLSLTLYLSFSLSIYFSLYISLSPSTSRISLECPILREGLIFQKDPCLRQLDGGLMHLQDLGASLHAEQHGPRAATFSTGTNFIHPPPPAHP